MVQMEPPGLEEQPLPRVCTVALDGPVRVEMGRVWDRWSASRPVVGEVEEAGKPERVVGKMEVAEVVGRPAVGKMAGQQAGKMVGEEGEEGAGNLVAEQKRRQPELEVAEVVDRPVGADIEA